jgi:alkylated DNA nucleotide flippase Atl1
MAAKWRSKLEDDKDLPRVVEVSAKMRKQFGVRTMVIARPRDVDAAIRRVRKGKLATFGSIRSWLAHEHGAEAACPFTTGIFLRIVAETAEEDRGAGKKRITPYWRVVKDNGALNPKYPGGVAAQSKKLRAEGHTVRASKGKAPPRVADLEKARTTIFDVET